MKVVIARRGDRKPTQMVKACAKSGATIVCAYSAKNYYLAIAADMRLEIPKPISYAEFIGGNCRKRGVTSVCIDNVSSLLNRMTKVPIEIVMVDENLIEN